MEVPFVDLNREYGRLKPEIDAAIQDVLSRGDFILGKGVADFEKAFADFCCARFGIGVASGTDALHLVLRGLGIGQGDKVITAANTFIATALGATFAGATPVFIDVDPLTYNIDPVKLREYLKSRQAKNVKAIIPVHLYGHPADMDPILRIAKEFGLKVVEDACQAHGAVYKGEMVGGFGEAACFSFYPAKNLGAYGDGGIVVTNKKSMADKIIMLRNYGQKKKYHHLMQGYNSRLDTLQAAVLSVKLRYLEAQNENRRVCAQLYGRLLEGSGFVLPIEQKGCRHVYHLYVIRVKKRQALQDYLKEKGISTGIHYPISLHMTKAYACLGYKRNDFPVSEKAAGEILSLPMFGGLKKEEVEYIADYLRRF